MNAIARSFDDYQTWTQQTAVFPEAHTIQYLGLGLGDEAGELLDKADRLTRSLLSRLPLALANEPAPTVPSRSDVLDEAGDVLWYLAQLLRARGHSLGTVYEAAMRLEAAFEASLIGTATEVSIASSLVQGRLKKELRDGTVDEAKIVHYAARVMRALDALARACGSHLSRVAEVNQQKLNDRKQRNVIRGEGDAR